MKNKEISKEEKDLKVRKSVFELFKNGVNLEHISKLWKEYNSHYCNFSMAYQGQHGKDKPDDAISHFSVKYDEKEYYLCEKHSKEKCWKCGRPATEECSFAGQFVCGTPCCPDHPHEH